MTRVLDFRGPRDHLIQCDPVTRQAFCRTGPHGLFAVLADTSTFSTLIFLHYYRYPFASPELLVSRQDQQISMQQSNKSMRLG